MAKQTSIYLLKSIEKLVKHCENVPELRADIHRVKNYLRQWEDKPISSSKMHKMEYWETTEEQKGIAI